MRTTLGKFGRSARWVVAPAAFGLGLLAGGVALAGGVVGDGTAPSCTEASLRGRLVGGGFVSFACGAGATIDITDIIDIESDTTIDGGGTITLRKHRTWAGLFVREGVQNAEFRRLAFVGGTDVGGSIGIAPMISNDGILAIIGCTVALFRMPGPWGAIDNTGHLRIADSEFRANSIASNSINNNGGVISGSGTIEIEGSHFVGSRVEGDGGAIDYRGPGTLRIWESSFLRNHATGSGGAIHITREGTLEVLDSSFRENHATLAGGAIHVDQGTRVEVDDVDFRRNTAGGNGGAVSVEERASAELRSINFDANSAALYGGALFNRGETTIVDSTLAENRISADGEGGAVASLSGGQLRIARSFLLRNTATNGGGLANSGFAVLEHVVFYLNRAHLDGGGISHRHRVAT